MNVGLTRAKSSLFVLGDARRLAANKDWRALIEDAKARQHYRKVCHVFGVPPQASDNLFIRQVNATTFLKSPTVAAVQTTILPASRSARRRRARAAAAALNEVVSRTGAVSLGS